jgi:asparagine synthase (glutamine-hydrolysing)
LTEAEAQTLYSDQYRDSLRGLALRSIRREIDSFSHPDNQLRSLFFNLTNCDRRLYFNFVIFKGSHFENRCPFYDYSLVEWLAGLPLKQKINKKLHRSILSRRAPRLALIPYDKDYRLPVTNQFLREAHAIYTRVLNKLGPVRWKPTLYADYENYLRCELRDWAEDILFDKRTLGRKIFRPEALRSLMDRHLAGHEEWTIGKIAPIITFEMMLRRYFDESP